MSTRVALVGAGPVGLMALKNLTEDGFDVTSFEKRAYVGGLWNAADDSYISVTRNTIFNSSRFVSAITDFPFPDHHDDFPSAPQLVEYLNAYADHFSLRKHIRLSTEVISVRRIDQQWEVKSCAQGSDPVVEYFDKLLVSTGSFLTPRIPELEGIERFQGKTVHSINFPDPSEFKDENVLLVGLHATAQDISVELSKHASKVHIAHRTGVVMISRFDENGRTFDQMMSLNFFLKFFLFMLTYFPTMWNKLADSILVKMSKKAYPLQLERKEWNMLPAPSVAVATPVVADELFPLMESGFATPVAAVRRITGPKQVTLTDGRVLENIDSIIYCTGYDFDVPQFVPQEFHPYPVRGKSPYLYRNIFPLHHDPAIRNSLAFLGQAGFPFPGFAQFEMYGLAVSQIWQGNSKLPELKKMQQWYDDNITWRTGLMKKYNHFSFYTAFLQANDMVPWLIETVGTGMIEHTSWFSLKAWKFWWEDRAFYKLVTTGLFTPPIWRLFDTGKRKAWAGAKEQIIKDNKFAEMRAKERVKKMKKEKEEKKIS